MKGNKSEFEQAARFARVLLWIALAALAVRFLAVVLFVWMIVLTIGAIIAGSWLALLWVVIAAAAAWLAFVRVKVTYK